jgi:hypothetical protein
MHEVSCEVRNDLSDDFQFKERFLILLWTMSSGDSEEAGIEMA